VEALLAKGGAVEADLVLVGIGAIPNVEIAKAAGLAVDNGIMVDAHMLTEDPAILAIGDCCNHPSTFTGGRLRLESVQGAIDQANTAAKTLTANPTPYDKVPWFWSDQYDEKLQIAGLPLPGGETVLRQHADPRQLAVFHLRDGRLRAVEAINAARDYMTGRKIMEAGGAVKRALLADPKAGLKDLIA
jgi:3-phenylpropionate/trans-cinnamate dioxygenase ferredoxin reductase subunit